jgi:hypothetical protein
MKLHDDENSQKNQNRETASWGERDSDLIETIRKAKKRSKIIDEQEIRK